MLCKKFKQNKLNWRGRESHFKDFLNTDDAGPSAAMVILVPPKPYISLPAEKLLEGAALPAEKLLEGAAGPREEPVLPLNEA